MTETPALVSGGVKSSLHSCADLHVFQVEIDEHFFGDGKLLIIFRISEGLVIDQAGCQQPAAVCGNRIYAIPKNPICRRKKQETGLAQKNSHLAIVFGIECGNRFEIRLVT